MVRRRKGGQRKASNESDEDTGPINRVFGGKKKGMMLDSGSEHSEGEKENKSRAKVEVSKEDPGSSGRKGKILRCADSSDDETTIPEATPKAERMKKLEEMMNRVNAKKAKKKVRYSSSTDDQGPGDSADEENLPMWENEEAPPEKAKVFVEDPEEKEDSDLEDFVVSDGNEEADAEAGRLPDSSDEGETRNKTATRKKGSSARRGNLGILNLSGSEASENVEASSSRRTRSFVEKRENSRERKRRKKVKALISDTEKRSSSSEETE